MTEALGCRVALTATAAIQSSHFSFICASASSCFAPRLILGTLLVPAGAGVGDDIGARELETWSGEVGFE